MSFKLLSFLHLFEVTAHHRLRFSGSLKPVFTTGFHGTLD